VAQTQELLQKWDDWARRPRMEISGEGLTLGAGTVLAGMARDERGRQRLALRDGPRAMALLATAYGQPVEAYVLAKICRAAELWNEGEKALAHIHLSFAGLPPCDGEDQMLRLFLAEECLAAGVTPAELMQAQGFDPASLALWKYSADQSRVPAGSGRASGQWASDGNTSEAQPPPTATPPTSNNVQVEKRCTRWGSRCHKGEKAPFRQSN
jgi:hypothetical protein